MSFLARLFVAPRVQVQATTLGLLDLSGGAATALTAADRTALEPLFRRVVESADVELPRFGGG